MAFVPEVPNLLQSVSNANYYGRIKVRGKPIRQSGRVVFKAGQWDQPLDISSRQGPIAIGGAFRHAGHEESNAAGLGVLVCSAHFLTPPPTGLPLSGAEFVRRVLQHVRPKSFQPRQITSWRGAAATAKWERIVALLDWRVPALVPPPPVPAPVCPGCGKTMVLIAQLARKPP